MKNCPILNIYLTPSGPAFWTPTNFAFQVQNKKICEKISVWLVNRFPKWYVMIPLHQNSQTSLVPWKRAFSRPGTHGGGSPTQQYDFFAEQSLKISVYFMRQIKSFPFYCQTLRQKDADFASLYAWARFFLYGNLNLSQHSFVHFAHSLCL